MITGTLSAFPMCCGAQVLTGLGSISKNDPRLSKEFLVRSGYLYHPRFSGKKDQVFTEKDLEEVKLPPVLPQRTDQVMQQVYQAIMGPGTGMPIQPSSIITNSPAVNTIFCITNQAQEAVLTKDLKESGFIPVLKFDSIHAGPGNGGLTLWTKTRLGATVTSVLPPVIKEVPVDTTGKTAAATPALAVPAKPARKRPAKITTTFDGF